MTTLKELAIATLLAVLLLLSGYFLVRRTACAEGLTLLAETIFISELLETFFWHGQDFAETFIVFRIVQRETQ